MAYGMSNRPTKRELKTATQHRKKLERRVESLQNLGIKVPPTLLTQLSNAQHLELSLKLMRGGDPA